MSEVIPVVPLPPAGALKKKPSGGLLPFASLLCYVHSTSSSDQRLSSVTLAKADASPTSDIGDDGWEEGTAKEQADIQHRSRSWEGLSKSTLEPWSLAISALTSPPGLVLPTPKSILRDEKCGPPQGSFGKQGKGTWQIRRHILLFKLLKELSSVDAVVFILTFAC